MVKDKVFVGTRHVFHALTVAQQKPINAGSTYSQKSVPSDRCLRCHAEYNRKFTSTKGLNVTSKMHMKHLNSGLLCTTCHNRVTHLGSEKYEPNKSLKPGFKYKNYLKMRQGCWRCHSQDPKYRNEATLKIVAGKSPPTTCTTCHNQLWNKMPHVSEYNHDDVNGVPWRSGDRHGAVAQKDFSACLACHMRKPGEQKGNKLPNCTTTCHKGVTMPHNIPRWAVYVGDKSTPDWLRVHPEAADAAGVAQGPEFKAGDPNFVCSMCHNKDQSSANFCQECHHKKFHEFAADEKAPWKSQHPAIVKEIGSTGCQNCHLLEFCAFCHTNGQRPPRGRFLNRTRQTGRL